MTADRNSIRNWRQRMTLSQRTAGKALGLSTAMVKSIEAGRREVSVRVERLMWWHEHETGPPDDMTNIRWP